MTTRMARIFDDIYELQIGRIVDEIMLQPKYFPWWAIPERLPLDPQYEAFVKKLLDREPMRKLAAQHTDRKLQLTARALEPYVHPQLRTMLVCDS